jgi:hypothetical protein
VQTTALLTLGIVVLDLGAYVSCFALLTSRLVGPKSKVIAIEAVESNLVELFYFYPSEAQTTLQPFTHYYVAWNGCILDLRPDRAEAFPS